MFDLKSVIQQRIADGLQSLYPDMDRIDASLIQLDRTKDPKHGDYATNVAMVMAKQLGVIPRDLAASLVDQLISETWFDQVSVAGPGFINFTVASEHLQQVIPVVLKAASHYGHADVGSGESVHLEYVSANPTGPLHVGHGRGAAFGACVANLLTAVGYRVHQEYYVNDAGRQMRILALSVWLRAQALQGQSCELPASAYQGDYIIDIARLWLQQPGGNQVVDISGLVSLGQSFAEDQGDALIDAAVDWMIGLLGETTFDQIRRFSLEHILDDIKADLQEFGVHHDEWFYESRLMTEGLLEASLTLLKEQGYVYQQDGATWFSATTFGDDKDRVLVRENGQPTYFASDVAYHLYKYRQGYQRMIDVFGADHHGYIARINAFLQGLGKDPQQLHILLVQFAILYRGKEKVSMSTRGGEFVTLRQLRDDVGNDAARYFYVMRKPEQHLDFDLELAKSRNNDNPVYYIQYAHARICSVWKQCQEQSLSLPGSEVDLSVLNSSHERELLKTCMQYPEVLVTCAKHYEPHTLANFLHGLAGQFHRYYNASQFLVDDELVRHARLQCIAAVKQVLFNGLALLGLSAPEAM